LHRCGHQASTGQEAPGGLPRRLTEILADRTRFRIIYPLALLAQLLHAAADGLEIVGSLDLSHASSSVRPSSVPVRARARHGWRPVPHQIIYRANILIAETDEKAQQA
jgi:hypothetical protein